MPTSSRAVLTRLDGAVPPTLATHAAAWRADSVVAEPSFAASVLLLRDGGEGLQTYLLHRHARMPFAPNMVVFPGGRLDPGDASLRACGVRETTEETGVMLDPAALVDWAHWITPEFEPRRYDTRFYLAALPAGAAAADVSGETDRAEWSDPDAALRAADRGELALLPPTRSLLLELTAFRTVGDALDAGRDRIVEPVLPQLVDDGGRLRFRYPRPSSEPVRSA